METVRNKFFHIHQINHFDYMWQVGAKLVIGNVKNEFSNFYDNVHFLIQKDLKTMHCIQYLEQVLEEQKNTSFVFIPLNDFKVNLDAFKESRAFIRESIFENVRQLMFPELPSRLRCVWLCEEKELELWRTKFPGKQLEIFEVEANGKIHFADAGWLFSDTISNSQNREFAIKYWNGEKALENEFKEKEILFEGEIKIIRRI